jgi:hypothetical protein
MADARWRLLLLPKIAMAPKCTDIWDEAAQLARLTHPAIVTLYDFGEMRDASSSRWSD